MSDRDNLREMMVDLMTLQGETGDLERRLGALQKRIHVAYEQLDERMDQDAAQCGTDT